MNEQQRVQVAEPQERLEGVRFKEPERLSAVPSPSILVVSLSDLQAGHRHGAWLAADQSETELDTGIQRMLRRSPISRRNGRPVEDWAIAAQRGFGAAKLLVFDDLAWVSAVARGIVKHGDAFAAWAKHQEDADALAGFERAFLGEHADLTELGSSQIEALGVDRQLRNALPDRHRKNPQYLAWAAGHDLVNSGTVWIHPNGDGGLWAYRACGSEEAASDVVELTLFVA